MGIPTNEEIHELLKLLDTKTAESLESQFIEFKRWVPDIHKNQKAAIEYTQCFANGEGGVIIFGVDNKAIGRSNAIHGASGYDINTWRTVIFENVRPHIVVEVEELSVPEGTKHLLIVRVPKGDSSELYGTAGGLFQRRVGKSCMAIDSREFLALRVSTGVVDWSGQPAEGITYDDLNPLEITRARTILKSKNPTSGLLELDDHDFLIGLDAIKNDVITNTGLLLFGKQQVLMECCPQNQVHYVHQVTDSKISRNDIWNTNLLQVIEKVEGIFLSPINPEEEVTVGLFKIRIPSFPIEVVREAFLNAVTHRDYNNHNEVLIHHSSHDLLIISPGSFVTGVSTTNILRCGPNPRNRTLANAFVKLRLVEAAGTGCKNIFKGMLEYGKRKPQYEADYNRVSLKIFDGTFDRSMARLVSEWQSKGRDVGLNELIILNYLKIRRFITSSEASKILQLDIDDTITALDEMSDPKRGILDRKGHTRTATYYLKKFVAKDLLGKAAYSSARGIDPARYQEMVRGFVQDYGCISNSECRELLGLGDSQSAKVQVSRYLKRWSSTEGFLEAQGSTTNRKYYMKNCKIIIPDSALNQQ